MHGPGFILLAPLQQLGKALTDRWLFSHIIPTTWLPSSPESKDAWRRPVMLLSAIEME
jgi:hypothetical protein